MDNIKLTKNNLALIISIVIGLCGGLLIMLFNLGKIIDVPFGTHEGGIIIATGVAIIIPCMIIVGIVIIRLVFYRKGNGSA